MYKIMCVFTYTYSQNTTICCVLTVCICEHTHNFIHCIIQIYLLCLIYTKSKGIPRQAEVALGVPGKLRPLIFSTFGNTRVVGRQPNAPAAFTPGEIPGTHFQRLSRPQGTWFCRKEPRKKSQVTPPGINAGTVRLVAQHLNSYATPGPIYIYIYIGLGGFTHDCCRLTASLVDMHFLTCLCSSLSCSLAAPSLT